MNILIDSLYLTVDWLIDSVQSLYNSSGTQVILLFMGFFVVLRVVGKWIKHIFYIQVLLMNFFTFYANWLISVFSAIIGTFTFLGYLFVFCGLAVFIRKVVDFVKIA